jgi:hypothetical protein
VPDRVSDGREYAHADQILNEFVAGFKPGLRECGCKLAPRKMLFFEDPGDLVDHIVGNGNTSLGTFQDGAPVLAQDLQAGRAERKPIVGIGFQGVPGQIETATVILERTAELLNRCFDLV